MSDSAWSLIQILYWLALSTWFGGVFFVFIMAPIIIRAVREDNPIMTSVLSVNLEGQHATLLGGSIVGKIMSQLLRIELACAGAMLIALVGQFILLHPAGEILVFTLLRSALYLAAVALLLYNYRTIWPAILRHRQEYIDHADEPEVANPALDRFNRYQRENDLILLIRVGLLLAVILFSANIRPMMIVSL